MTTRRKFDPVYDHIYAPFANNPAGNRLSNVERMYIRVLTELSINRFKWIDLPDTVDMRFLEMTLFYNALCVFYKDTDEYKRDAKGNIVERNGEKVVARYGTDRFMALRAARGGVINMYDNPTEFTVIGNSMVHRTLNARECVPIWANFMRIPDLDIVYMYAGKLSQIDRTIDINLDAMRHPYVIVCDESERTTFANLMRQVKEGQPVIWGQSSLNMDKVQLLDLGIDRELVPNLQIAKTRIWNECMTLLGINNANQDKRERLVASEVDANNEQVTASKAVSLQSREIACEQINDMFGLDIRVAWNPAVVEQAQSFAFAMGGPVSTMRRNELDI